MRDRNESARNPFEGVPRQLARRATLQTKFQLLSVGAMELLGTLDTGQDGNGNKSINFQLAPLPREDRTVPLSFHQ
jgi:hypothetical protein